MRSGAYGRFACRVIVAPAMTLASPVASPHALPRSRVRGIGEGGLGRTREDQRGPERTREDQGDVVAGCTIPITRGRRHRCTTPAFNAKHQRRRSRVSAQGPVHPDHRRRTAFYTVHAVRGSLAGRRYVVSRRSAAPAHSTLTLRVEHQRAVCVGAEGRWRGSPRSAAVAIHREAAIRSACAATPYTAHRGRTTVVGQASSAQRHAQGGGHLDPGRGTAIHRVKAKRAG